MSPHATSPDVLRDVDPVELFVAWQGHLRSVVLAQGVEPGPRRAPSERTAQDALDLLTTGTALVDALTRSRWVTAAAAAEYVAVALGVPTARVEELLRQHTAQPAPMPAVATVDVYLPGIDRPAGPGVVVLDPVSGATLAVLQLPPAAVPLDVLDVVGEAGWRMLDELRPVPGSPAHFTAEIER